uniref:F-box domain-containing protein n=1 Tax=Mycena chlorophos TaxID=658473 RepID=A0ABQ0M9M9_MYCCL|nr:predicted protein [Mycena chlorophos]
MYLPQELYDVIIDLLQDSPAALRNCSLICRAFVDRAQSHLFRKIDIQVSLSFLPKSAAAESECVLRVQRLCRVLVDSPHILEYIQSIHIGVASAALVAPLAAVPWSTRSRIQRVALLKIPSSTVLLSEGVRALVEIPSLQALVLSFAPGPEVDKPTRADLKAFFSRCSDATALRSLEITGCSIKANHPTQRHGGRVGEPYRGPIGWTERPRIHRLGVFLSADLMDAFNSSFFPLDLSQLRELHLFDLRPRMSEFFTRNCASVTDLFVHSSRYNEELIQMDLSGFTSLTRIHLLSGWQTDVLGNLPPTNRVAHLQIVVVEMSLSNVFRHRWTKFEEQVLTHMPALVAVEVVYRFSSRPAPEMDGSGEQQLQSHHIGEVSLGVVRVLEKVLPRLHERRFLNIRFMESHNPR